MNESLWEKRKKNDEGLEEEKEGKQRMKKKLIKNKWKKMKERKKEECKSGIVKMKKEG